MAKTQEKKAYGRNVYYIRKRETAHDQTAPVWLYYGRTISNRELVLVNTLHGGVCYATKEEAAAACYKLQRSFQFCKGLEVTERFIEDDA